ncbi:MAG: AMP-binding protein [Candidatus Nanopelagicales bacterium]
MSLLLNADFAPLVDLAAHRQALWERQRGYILERSPLLRDVWGVQEVPSRLEDIESLPLVDKELLRASQRSAPPFGAYLAADPVDVLRVHRTGGTSGEAMNIALSAADADQTAIVGARAQRASGLRPDDVVVHCLNYQMWMGGFTDHTTLEATGATVVPFGVGNPELLLRTIRDLGVTAISCTPSYPAVLEDVLATQGVLPRELGLRLGLFGGEAALDVPGFRARLEETWGFAARNSNYGVTDVMCNLAGQCEEQDALHLVGLDVVHPELIDTQGRGVPWESGASGELVLTHVARDCQPLVRFCTGDIVVVESTQPCACGRTAPRFRVVDRADDMVVVRGVNVFPTSVAALVTADPSLSGEYRIVLPGPGPYDYLPLDVERSRTSQEEAAPIAARIEMVARADLRVSARVRVLDFGELPRTEGKTRRVIRPQE